VPRSKLANTSMHISTNQMIRYYS